MFTYYRHYYKAVYMNNFDCPHQSCTVFSATKHGLDVHLFLSHKKPLYKKEQGYVSKNILCSTTLSRNLVRAKRRFKLNHSNDSIRIWERNKTSIYTKTEESNEKDLDKIAIAH